MATAKPLVDDHLYVNDLAVEALRNIIESDVRSALKRSVLWPLLLAGIALLVVAATWLIPREITTLMREDPLVAQRFSQAAERATEEYIADPERGKKAIQTQVNSTLRADQDMQRTVSAAASAVVAELDVQGVVQQQVDAQIEARLNKEIKRFLNTQEGRDLVKEAVAEYFGTAAGQKSLDAVATKALRSPDFRNALVNDLDQILSR